MSMASARSRTLLLAGGWAAGLFLSASLVRAGEPAVKFKVGTKGLLSIRVNGAEWLQDGAPKVTKIVLEEQYHEAKSPYRKFRFEKPGLANPKAGFDAAAKRLTYGYAWGSAAFTYAPQPNGLDLTVALHNT